MVAADAAPPVESRFRSEAKGLPCRTFSVAGRCPRGDSCWYEHVQQPAAAPGGCSPRLLLSAPTCVLARALAAVSIALPGCSMSAQQRADERRGGERAVLVTPPHGVDVPTCAAVLSEVDAALVERLSRTLWVQSRADSAADVAAAVSALQSSPRLRCWPAWAAEPLRAALAAAGVALQPPLGAAFEASLVLDVAVMAGRWHWHLYAPQSTPALFSRGGRRPQAVPSRAYHKLDELFGRKILPALADDAWVADLGAAPGGWTLRLSAAAPLGRVFAVDPGRLTLSPLPANVTHLAVRAEQALETVRDALGVHRRLQLVCCDANVHPPAAVRLALSFADLLSGGGALVVSEKRFAAGRVAHEADCVEAEGLLRAAGFAHVTRLHLLANGAAERTLVALRSDDAPLND